MQECLFYLFGRRLSAFGVSAQVRHSPIVATRDSEATVIGTRKLEISIGFVGAAAQD
jgi:hypothetical protein